jgi:hypothetical protein
MKFNTTMLQKKIRSLIMIAMIPAIGFAQSDSDASGHSKGGLFVEPAITYEIGDAAVNYPSPVSSSTGSTAGLGIGGRLGFHLSEAFFIGADGRYSMPQFKDSTADYDAASVSSTWGPVIGVQMPNIGVRVWGTYIMGGELDPDQSGGLDVKFKDAVGYRIGVGFHVSVFSLNLEYQQLTYGSTDLEKIGPFTSGSFDNVELDNDAWILSASFPLAL